MPAKIAIVIPAYKAAPYLGATLDSVLAQTRADWECVIVDDGSPDDTAAVAETYVARDPRFRLLRQANAGVGSARNAGFARIGPEAEYVIFLDSDDVWAPDALEALAAALDTHPGAVGAHGLTHSIGSDGILQNDFFVRFGRERYGYESGRVVPLDAADPTTFTALLMRFTVYPPALALLRRSVLEDVGPWENALAPAEDWDMLVRMGRYGDFVFVNRVVAFYRRHGGNATATSRGHWVRKQKILRRLVTDPRGTPDQTRLIFDAYRAWNRFSRARRFRDGREALRQRRWKAAAVDLAWITVMLFAQPASVLDLRFHRARRPRPPLPARP